MGSRLRRHATPGREDGGQTSVCTLGPGLGFAAHQPVQTWASSRPLCASVSPSTKRGDTISPWRTDAGSS